MSYKMFFFKSSMRQFQSFKAAIPGENNLWIHSAIFERQTPALLEMIPYLAFYGVDLRLSPLTGLVITADLGCRG